MNEPTMPYDCNNVQVDKNGMVVGLTEVQRDDLIEATRLLWWLIETTNVSYTIDLLRSYAQHPRRLPDHPEYDEFIED